ncbi:MAG: S8 family serine peptidase [Gammaproteobacteria bacterium]|nr:S8 family serine peptidase [Gammaproteobacteria bacterium]
MADNYRTCLRVGFLFLLAAAIPICTLSLAQAASPEAALALRNDPTLPYAPDSILIRFKPTATPAEKSQALTLANAQRMRVFSIVNGLEQLQVRGGRGVERALERLNQLPFVDYAEPDFVRKAITNDTHYGLQWGLENTGQDIRGVKGRFDADIDAEKAWSSTIGNPDVVVAVIDTGVDYTHEDLVANVWINPGEIAGDGIDNDGNGYVDDIYGWDFWSNDADPMDEQGHGTHVAGTICAEGNNGIGVSGVVWRCRIMALRFLGPDGGFTSGAIAALQYAVDKGVKVSNNSWGGGGYSSALYDAIRNAGKSGHLFIAAAGNDATNTDSTPHYPSSYDLDNILSVAATNNKDQLAGFSNYGAKTVDLGAPGVDIASTTINSGYAWSSGTSMAAPHVAGVALLILDLNPHWTHSEIKNQIMSTTRPIAALEGKTVSGGLVNAYNSILGAVAAPAAPSDLAATATAHDRIDLAWMDHADNETGFTVERSGDNTSWATVGTVAQNTTRYSDSGLDAETNYHYRVAAYNSAGQSDYSNTTSAVTDATPTYQEIVSSGEIFGAGSVKGSYKDTWAADGVVQSITEITSGGRPALRYSYLQHTWIFEVPPGSNSLHINAWSTVSKDNDEFRFSYSLDNAQYSEMLTLSGGDNDSWHRFFFPAGTSGTLYVRVTDTDRTAGNQALDTISVDQLYIISEQEAGDPPAAPSDLSGDASIQGQVKLSWIDNAESEHGFEVARSEDGGSTWFKIATPGADSTTYTDGEVASETRYAYRVRAYNGAGHSDWSNTASVTTAASTSAVELSATGYKVRGWQSTDLVWTDSQDAFHVYRDAVLIATNVSGGSYTDANIGKGGASYSYQVCRSTDTSVCSNSSTVVF